MQTCLETAFPGVTAVSSGPEIFDRAGMYFVAPLLMKDNADFCTASYSSVDLTALKACLEPLMEQCAEDSESYFTNRVSGWTEAEIGAQANLVTAVTYMDWNIDYLQTYLEGMCSTECAAVYSADFQNEGPEFDCFPNEFYENLYSSDPANLDLSESGTYCTQALATSECLDAIERCAVYDEQIRIRLRLLEEVPGFQGLSANWETCGVAADHIPAAESGDPTLSDDGGDNTGDGNGDGAAFNGLSRILFACVLLLTIKWL